VKRVTWIISLILIASCGKKESPPPTPKLNTPGPGNNIPKENLWENNYQKKFNSLPLSGQVESKRTLWSGDHWSFNSGSINKRWYLENEESSLDISPNEQTIYDYSMDDLSFLSPSEKFDLLHGSYNYPLKNEMSLKINPLALNWEGLGNGWASATLLHPEPRPIILENPQGVQIPFGSSDIKAILSYYFAFGKNLPQTKHLGFRCFVREINSSTEPACFDDLNPKDFHITLANEIGLRKKSIIVDVDQFEAVWNHPVESYRIEIDESSDSRLKKIKLYLTYVANSEKNSWEQILGTNLQKKVTRIYQYELKLDTDGEIISGKWMSKDRPDFIWKLTSKAKFEGYFKLLEKLLQ
jgi:Transglutaminase elicitor